MKRWQFHLCLLLAISSVLWSSGVLPAIVPAGVPAANKTGNSTRFQISAASSTTAGDCPGYDASGNLVDSGQATCGGSGTTVSSVFSLTGAVPNLSGDATTSNSTAVTVAKINGTSVPTNSAADQFLGTTASATAAWASVPNCTDTGGNHLNYATSTHTYSCGTSSAGGVSSVFTRTGAVVAVSGDYTAAQVTNAAATNTANSFSGTQTVASGNLAVTNGTFNLHQITFSNNNDHSFNVNGNSQTIYSFADGSACSGGWQFGIGIGACPGSVLDVEGQTNTAGFGITYLGIKLVAGGLTGSGGNNSGVSGVTGGGITLTGGIGGGFSGGSGSTGGTGGSITITGGAGGPANSTSTNGNGGDVNLVPGAAGNGAGTAALSGRIFLKAHAEFQAIVAPTLGSCGGGSPSLGTGATDNAGTINVGTGVTTSCVLNFGRAFTNNPACAISDDNTAVTGDVSAISTTSVTFSFSASLGSGHIYYVCF